MIFVNDESLDWSQNMTVFELLKIMGYKLKTPAVFISINGEVVRRDAWNHFHIPDKAEISVVNMLKGG